MDLLLCETFALVLGAANLKKSFSFVLVATIQSHLLSVDVAVLDEGGAADVDRHVLGRLAVLDEALLHIVLLAFLLLEQKVFKYISLKSSVVSFNHD